MTSEEVSFWQKFFWPKDQIHQHWYSAVDNFHHITADFYQRIESELVARKVPGLEISRVEFSEGGPLSGKREYLRLKRERLVFDICAAPFGTSYFFSFRLVELPLGIKPWELLIFLFGFVFVAEFFIKSFGIISGVFVLFMVLAASCYIMRNAVALGLRDLDTTLLKTPVIGPVYEVLFRKETYFRQDTRLMYLSTVNGITEALVEEVTLAKGIKLVKRFDRKPIHGELYQERTRPSEKTSEPAAPPAS